jgi:CheY-like chemotaxis protein
MKAAILIVGDDLALLETRAAMLKAWHVSTTTAEHAVEAIRSTAHDLIIFCTKPFPTQPPKRLSIRFAR